MNYQSKPVKVKAIRLLKENFALLGKTFPEIKSWKTWWEDEKTTLKLVVPTPDGKKEAILGDWIVQDFRKEFHLYNNRDFLNKFEEIK